MQALCLLFSKLQMYGRKYVKPKMPTFETMLWSHSGPQRERRKSLQAFIDHQNKLSDIQARSSVMKFILLSIPHLHKIYCTSTKGLTASNLYYSPDTLNLSQKRQVIITKNISIFS